MGVAAALGIVAMLVLGIFLGAKELTGAVGMHNSSMVRIAKFLEVGIWPLVIVFGVTVAFKIFEIQG